MTTKPKPAVAVAEGMHVPAHLRPFVEVLGIDGAVDFFLAFGGGYSYFSQTPDGASPIAAVVGVDKAAQLARSTGGGSMRVPTAKPFLARVFHARGMGTSQIARRLHVTDTSVRGWLKEPDRRQMSLF